MSDFGKDEKKEKGKNLGDYICEFLGREGEIKYNINHNTKERTNWLKYIEDLDNKIKRTISKYSFNEYDYKDKNDIKKIQDSNREEQLRDTSNNIFSAVYFDPVDLEKQMVDFESNCSEIDKKTDSYRKEKSIRESIKRISANIRDIYENKEEPANLIQKLIKLEIRGLLRENIYDLKTRNYIKKKNNIKKEIKLLAVLNKIVLNGSLIELSSNQKKFSKEEALYKWNDLLKKEKIKKKKSIKKIILLYLQILKLDDKLLTIDNVSSELAKILFSEFVGDDKSFDEINENYEILSNTETESEISLDSSSETSSDSSVLMSNSNSDDYDEMVLSKQSLMNLDYEYISNHCLEEYLDSVRKEQGDRFKQLQAHLALLVRLYLKSRNNLNKDSYFNFTEGFNFDFENPNDETECIKEFLNGNQFQNYIINEPGKIHTVSDGTVTNRLKNCSYKNLMCITEACVRKYKCESGEIIVKKFSKKLTDFLEDLYLDVIGENRNEED